MRIIRSHVMEQAGSGSVRGKFVRVDFFSECVDWWFRNPIPNHRLGFFSALVKNWDFNYQPSTGEFTGFRTNHQQYRSTLSPFSLDKWHLGLFYLQRKKTWACLCLFVFFPNLQIFEAKNHVILEFFWVTKWLRFHLYPQV